jgi:HK97 family phage major capsid protein
MSAVIEAKTAMRTLATKAQEVVKDDSLTNAEKKTNLDNIEADIKSTPTPSPCTSRPSASCPVASRPGGEVTGAGAARGKSFAQQVIESDGYKSMVSGQSKGHGRRQGRATIDEGIIPAFSGGAGLGGQLVAPQLLPGIVGLKFQPLTVADLLASGTTDSSSISYVIESAFQDLTATVLEKGTKPQLDLTLARRQDNVTKIANVAKVTDEMFQDAPQFQSYLSKRMVFGVKRVEEASSSTATAPRRTCRAS